MGQITFILKSIPILIIRSVLSKLKYSRLFTTDNLQRV